MSNNLFSQEPQAAVVAYPYHANTAREMGKSSL